MSCPFKGMTSPCYTTFIRIVRVHLIGTFQGLPYAIPRIIKSHCYITWTASWLPGDHLLPQGSPLVKSNVINKVTRGGDYCPGVYRRVF